MSADLRRLRLLYQDAVMLQLTLQQRLEQRLFVPGTAYVSASEYRRLSNLIWKAKRRCERRHNAFMGVYDAPRQRLPFPIITAAIAEQGAAILTKEGLEYVRNA